jgi:hypothetical protein
MSMKLPHRADTLHTSEFSAIAGNQDDLTLWVGLLILAVIAGVILCLLLTARVRRSRARRGQEKSPDSPRRPIDHHEMS